MRSLALIQLIEMNEDTNVKKIMHHKAFRNATFHKDREKMVEFIKAVQKMQIEEDTFKIIRTLIRFFRFPLLILFQPIYKRIQQQKQKYLHQHQEQLIKIAGLVKAIIKHNNYSSLQFYFKAGCRSTQIELKEDSSEEPFKRFVLEVDNKLNQRARNDPLEEDNRLKSIEDLLRKEQAVLSVPQQICIQQYLSQTAIRRLQIRKQLAPRRQLVKEVQSTKASSQIKNSLTEQKQPLIMINGPQERRIQDGKIANDHLCCRPYFYQNEIINQPETLVQQYKNYEIPYDRSLGDKLLKTICGFLNGRGGIIYIGIREDNQTKKRVVVGQKYSQNAKQDLLKYFRILCEKVSPDIVNIQLYKLEFVPLKSSTKKNQWVPGKYVARLRVEMGNQKDLYSFRKSDGEQLFAFRTENQVLTRKMGQQILQLYRKRLKSKDQKLGYLKHSGVCKAPELGYQLCIVDSSHNKIDLPWNNKTNSSNNKMGPRKDKQQTEMQKLQRSVYCSLPNSFLDDFKKFVHCSGKNFVIFIQPQDQKEQDCLEAIINKHNYKSKIKKISRLIEISNATMTHVQKVLGNVLYTEFSGNRIGFGSNDEVLLAIDLLDRQNIDYRLIFLPKNHH